MVAADNDSPNYFNLPPKTISNPEKRSTIAFSSITIRLQLPLHLHLNAFENRSGRFEAIPSYMVGFDWLLVPANASKIHSVEPKDKENLKKIDYSIVVWTCTWIISFDFTFIIYFRSSNSFRISSFVACLVALFDWRYDTKGFILFTFEMHDRRLSLSHKVHSHTHTHIAHRLRHIVVTSEFRLNNVNTSVSVSVC